MMCMDEWVVSKYTPNRTARGVSDPHPDLEGMQTPRVLRGVLRRLKSVARKPSILGMWGPVYLSTHSGAVWTRKSMHPIDVDKDYHTGFRVVEEVAEP